MKKKVDQSLKIGEEQTILGDDPNWVLGKNRIALSETGSEELINCVKPCVFGEREEGLKISYSI